ncbi:unnamed protein product [Lactuca virosa]|uniref:Serine hydrolase domain-containing protein n=1 Tax=Lactuca virosa TaxID=75947 RepID=A0AAU9NZN4_9ASTR|nr:unnamed protein product [Lactuca virosa]
MHLIVPPISNVTLLVINKSRVKIQHATLSSIYNRQNPPYICSNLTGTIHNLRSNRAVLEKTMGSEGSDLFVKRKPRILCLHGFRTSGEIFKTQLKKWPESVHEKVQFFFPDAPFPCNGKSEVEGIFDPPYYEWFQFNKDFTEYENFDKCLEHIEDLMIKHEIDGLMGFSQGAILSAALPGLQAKGLALTRVPNIRFVIIVSGAKLKNQTWADKAYSLPIQCPSLHFLGEADFLKPYGLELLKSVEDPIVIHHPKGHTIPRFDEEGLEKMLKFIDRVEKIVSNKEDDVVTVSYEESTIAA